MSETRELETDAVVFELITSRQILVEALEKVLKMYPADHFRAGVIATAALSAYRGEK